jgi:hypothetical protein
VIGEPGPPDETVELDADRWIVLVFERRWPKYVVSWSIRRRSGESDFPIARGEVEAPPSRDSADGEAIWAELRRQAIGQATASLAVAGEVAPKSRSLISRILGRP